MGTRPRIAVFRPPDERAERAQRTLESLGAHALVDPLIAPESTGSLPRDDADVLIVTSVTAASILDEADWRPPAGTSIAAIGPRTATAFEEIDLPVDIVPETYTSRGLVTALTDSVDGDRIEVARSDHGSAVLLEGLNDAGAYVHETVLYRLVRPPEAGGSLEAVLAGELDGLAFTSSLTVEHFVELAAERDQREALDAALETVAVGVIGDPTAQTARSHGLSVDVVADEATFEALARQLVTYLT